MVISKEIDSFFRRHNMHYEAIAFEPEINKFQKEMEAGLSADPSSLMMLPTYIPLREELPTGKPVIAIDAGGTNLRVGVVTLHTGEAPTMEHFKKYPMLGSQGHVSKDFFYESIIDYITPLLDYSEVVSFCFSFPSEILPNQDGKVICMTKEIYIDGIEGTLLGEELNTVLAQRGLPQKKFVILNDTVAALLGAVGHPLATGHRGNIGFILGTGINGCYGEHCRNITKVPCDGNEADIMVINMEAGGYRGFPQGTIDKQIDASSKEPGVYLFEKTISGAYQGQLVFLTAQLAAEEGLFSSQFKASLSAQATFHLWDLNEFYEHPEEGALADLCHTEEDRTRLLELFTMVQHRAARMVTVAFGAIMKQAEIGTDPAHPVAISAEGTTFQKTPIFRDFLDQYTKDILNTQYGLYCSYLSIPDATMIGTAVAGLSV